MHESYNLPSEIENKQQYALPSPNVKWVERGGGKAVPIFWDLDDNTLQSMLEKVNGILIPGSFDNLYSAGSRNIKPWTTTIFKIFDYSIEQQNMGKPFPIFGICFGLQALFGYQCEKFKVNSKECVKYFFIERQSLNLIPTNQLKEQYENSMFKQIEKGKFDDQAKMDITYNFHVQSIKKSTLDKYKDIRDQFNVLTYSSGTSKQLKSNDYFVSAVQHVSQPWQGVQFHPEKQNYEFNVPKQEGMVNTLAVSKLSSSITDFFIGECRNNPHQMTNVDMGKQLIQNWDLYQNKETYQYLFLFDRKQEFNI